MKKTRRASPVKCFERRMPKVWQVLPFESEDRVIQVVPMKMEKEDGVSDTVLVGLTSHTLRGFKKLVMENWFRKIDERTK